MSVRLRDLDVPVPDLQRWCHQSRRDQSRVRSGFTRLPVPVFHFWLILTHPTARSLCDSWASCINSNKVTDIESRVKPREDVERWDHMTLAERRCQQSAMLGTRPPFAIIHIRAGVIPGDAKNRSELLHDIMQQSNSKWINRKVCI